MTHSTSSFDDERVVRIFVSSTFRDFESERRILANSVFPKLRDKYAERGVSIVEIDLRWGLTEDKIRQEGLIDACLKEINRCSDFFGLLGQSYGTLVSSADVSASRILKTHGFRLAENKTISIAELEFELGMLSRENNYALLFISEMAPEPDSRNRTLASRAERLGYKAHRYQDLERFAEMAYEKLDALIEPRFPTLQDADDPEARAQKKTLRQHTQGYIGGNEKEAQLLKRLEGGQSTFLRGEKGAGKSALFSRCVNWLSENGCDVFYYYCNTGFCSNEVGLLRKIAAFLDETFDAGISCSDDADFSTLVDAVVEALANARGSAPASERGNVPSDMPSDAHASAVSASPTSPAPPDAQAQKRSLCIAIDAIEQIKTQRNLWLALKDPCESAGAFCLVTGTEKLAPDTDEIVLEGLEERQVEKLMGETFSSRGKSMDPGTMEKIVGCPTYRNPLMLKGLIGELLIGPSNDNLNSHVDALCQIRSIGELFSFSMDRLKRSLSKLGLNPSLPEDLADVIACSHFGATEDEVMRITAAPPLIWVSFKYTFDFFLTSFDGRYKFNHQLIEKEARRKPEDSRHGQMVGNAIGEYRQAPRSTARLCELANWASLGKNLDELAEILLDPKTSATMLTADQDAFTNYLSIFHGEENHLTASLEKHWKSPGFDLSLLRQLAETLSLAGCASTCIAIERLYSQENEADAQLMVSAARAHYKMGDDYDATVRAFDEAACCMRTQEGRGSLPMARLLLQRAIAKKSGGNITDAMEDAVAACDLFEEAGFTGHERNWANMYRANLEFALGIPDGLSRQKSAIESQEKLSGDRSYPYCRLLCYSWQRFAAQGELSKAESLANQSLQTLHANTGESPDYAWALTNMATILAMRGKFNEAREYSRESQRINDLASAQAHHVYSLTALNNEALITYLEEKASEAPETVREALAHALQQFDSLHELALSMHGSEHPYTLNLLANRTLVCLDANEVGDKIGNGAGGSEARDRADGEVGNRAGGVSELLSVARRLEKACGGPCPDSAFLVACAKRAQNAHVDDVDAVGARASAWAAGVADATSADADATSAASDGAGSNAAGAASDGADAAARRFFELDYATRAIATGKDAPNLRLAFNNGATLFLVPTFFNCHLIVD